MAGNCAASARAAAVVLFRTIIRSSQKRSHYSGPKTQTKTQNANTFCALKISGLEIAIAGIEI